MKEVSVSLRFGVRKGGGEKKRLICEIKSSENRERGRNVRAGQEERWKNENSILDYPKRFADEHGGICISMKK